MLEKSLDIVEHAEKINEVYSKILDAGCVAGICKRNSRYSL